MNPVRVFAKLGAQVPPMVNMGGATGRPEIDQCDAAALCAGMPEEWIKAARYKWALDDTVRDWLRIRLWMAAMELAQRERWQTKRLKCKTDVTLAMAECVLDEVADPQLNGAAWGNSRAKWRKIGGRFGVQSERAWHDTWRDKYTALYNVFDDWSGRAYRHVQKSQLDA